MTSRIIFIVLTIQSFFERFGHLTHENKKKRKLQDLMHQEIVNSVVQLIATQGLEHITMDRAATEAGITKGTLYLYFRNKEELLRTTMQASLTPLL